MRTNLKSSLSYTGGWKLNKVSELKYFKNGKANMHVETCYEVECVDKSGMPINSAPNRYWIKTKAEASKYFKIVTDTSLDALQRTNAIKAMYGQLIGE